MSIKDEIARNMRRGKPEVGNLSGSGEHKHTPEKGAAGYKKRQIEKRREEIELRREIGDEW